MEAGISIFLGTQPELNEKIIGKAQRANVKYAFTSLQIPEETVDNYEKAVKNLANKCKEAGIGLIADISPETLRKLSCSSIDEVRDWGITSLRLDYGYSAKETADISKRFTVFLNASTVTEKEILKWEKEGAELSGFVACHNFYPKPYTGLSGEKVKEINKRLKCFGLQTMAFVPGDGVLRGPLQEGLPTVEEHRFRKDDVLLHLLSLHYDLGCDRVAVGDIDVSDRVWKEIGNLNGGVVEIRAEIASDYQYITNGIHHDRVDGSSYLFRSVESRKYRKKVPPENCVERKEGSVCISNERYMRYEGELEIARQNLPADERVNVIGQVAPEDLKYLPYIRQEMGVRLVNIRRFS